MALPYGARLAVVAAGAAAMLSIVGIGMWLVGRMCEGAKQLTERSRGPADEAAEALPSREVEAEAL